MKMCDFPMFEMKCKNCFWWYKGHCTTGVCAAEEKEAVVMHYKDENTGWVYRVSPQPAERDLYFIEYLDPSNSVIFKRLPDYPGSKFKESAEEVLAARAQRNGWTPTAPPEIEPSGNDPSDVEEEETNVCCCARCQKSDCVCAGTCDAQSRAACDGRQNCSQSGCTYDVKRRGCEIYPFCCHCCGRRTCGRPGTLGFGQYDGGDCCRRLRTNGKCRRRHSCFIAGW